MALRAQKLQMGQNKIEGVADGTDPSDAINLGQLNTEVATLQAEIDALSPSTIANNTVLGNVSGSAALPAATNISSVIDAQLGTTRGALAYRGASGWTSLNPSTSGYYLASNGAGADPSYVAPPVAITTLRKASTSSVNVTSSSPIVDSDLTFTMAANTNYIIRAVLYVSFPNGLNLLIDTAGPSSPTSLRASAVTSYYLVNSVGTISNYGTIFNSGSPTGVISGEIDINLLIRNGSSSGSFQLKYYYTAGSGNAAQVFADSFLEYRTF